MSTTSVTESKMSEADYLEQQANEAKLRVGIALNQAKTALVEKMDPRQITNKHPILTILTATVGGFVAAAIAVPSKQEQEIRRLERLRQAMHPQPSAAASSDGKSDGRPAVEKKTLGATLLHEAIALIKPILLASITAGIKSATTPSPTSVPDDQTPPNPPT